jgi:outer membrane protein TolC
MPGALYGEDTGFTIDNAVMQAVKNSTAMAGLIGRAKVSEKIIFERWRTFLPDIAFRYQKDDTVIYRSEDLRSQSALVEFGYDINTNGKNFYEYKIANLEKFIAAVEIVIERNNIILQVKSRFYELIRMKDEIDVNKKLRESLIVNKKLTDEERRLGFTTKLNLTQIEARLLESDYFVKKSENDFYNKLKDFKAYIGYEFKGDIQAIDEMDFINKTVSSYSDAELVSMALKNRLELKRSELALLKTKYEMNLSKYYYLPKIRLEGSMGLNGTGFPPNNFTWNVGIKIDTSIFGNSMSGKQTLGEADGGNTRSSGTQARVGFLDDVSVLSRIVRTRSAFEEAENSYMMLVKSIRLEVVRNYKNIFETRDRLDVAIKNSDMFAEQLKIENEKFRLGEITVKDFLDSNIEYSKAKLRVLSARCDLKMAAAVFENSINFKGEK